MADRFPSLEDFDAGDTTVKSAGAPEGDFISRERAALGEDAELFASNDSKNVTIEDGDDDLLGGDELVGGMAPSAPNTADELDDFESSFPAVSTENENVGPGGTVTSTTSGYTNYTPQVALEQDTEAIRAWREKRDAEISRRDAASVQKREETVGTARKDIDSFYESYNRKVDRQKEQTKKEAEEFLVKREDTTAGGTSWERIAKLVDLSGKGQVGGGADSTKKRMRELLVSLKGDKDAPGAAGI